MTENKIITSIYLINVFKNRSTRFWLMLSLLIPIYFGLMSIGFYLIHPYLIQDDARHHVVWLQKFVDLQLFTEDFIADYFYGVAPAGYKFIYWLIAQMGIGAITLAKILPTILALITTVYVFHVSLNIFPRPEAAFLGTLIFNENLWMNDDLISATPRAFLYPIFAAFIYYLIERSLFYTLLTLALLGLFFPQFLLVALALLTAKLFQFKGKAIRFSKNKENYIFWISGLIIAAIILSIFAVQLSEFGETFNGAQMKIMPEFGLNGRVEYFGVNLLYFILDGNSGLNLPLYPFPILLSLALPLFLKLKLLLTQFITSKIQILFSLIVASLGLFFLAHIFLFKLYFPSRYTYHSFIFIMAISSGIVLFIMLNYGVKFYHKLQRESPKSQLLQIISLRIAAIVLTLSLVLPFIPIVPFIFQGWVIGKYPELYQFFSTQPKDTLIASLADEIDNLPAFSQRSVLVGGEFALPHHIKYYQEIYQRTLDLIQAQYSSDLEVITNFIHQYNINFLLLESNFNQPNYLLEKPWLVNSSFKKVVLETLEQLKQGKKLAITPLIEPCSVFTYSNFQVLDTTCITQKELKR